MTLRFRSTNETSKIRRRVTNNAKNSTKFHFFLSIDDFLFFVRNLQKISSDFFRMRRCLFAFFAFYRRYDFNTSIISIKFHFRRKFVSEHCYVYRAFYAQSYSIRVLFDVFTTDKRHWYDEISSNAVQFFDINLFSRFAMTFHFQVHREYDHNKYWNMIRRLI
jgi:hypothetical protein